MPNKKKRGGNKNKGGKKPQPKQSPNKKKVNQQNKKKQSPKKSQQINNDNNNNLQTQPIIEDKNDPIIKYKNLGNDEFTEAKYEKAIEYYNKAIGLDNESLKTDIIKVENEKTNNNEFKTDINEDKIKGHHNQIHTIYSNRCAAYTHLKKYDLAIIDADKCIELKNDWFKGYVRKANIYIEKNDYDMAEDVYTLGQKNCDINDVKGKNILRKCRNDLDTLRLNKLKPDEKIVGGKHEQADKFKRLISWLIQGGAKFPKLYLKFYSSEYRAIHAMEKIAKDEDICYIPHDYIMTSDVAKASKIGRAIIESQVELRSKHSYLAAYLLQEKEKGEKSKWFIYISILPKKFVTIPLFFNEKQRKELIGSIALKKIDDRLESLKLEYDALCDAVDEFDRFTLEEFTWARLVVITRIFGLVVDDNKTDGLVPMADMLNHKRPRETKWTYDEKKRGFLITTLQTIKKEAEIFDSYGRKCNSRFFVNYGFSLEYNLDNEALLVLELAKTDPQFNIKAKYLGFNIHGNNFKKEFQIPRQYKEKKVKECFSFLRVLHAQGNEFLVITSHDGIRLDDIPPLSIRNETNVLTSLAVAATKSLKLFNTTLNEDNELLKDEIKYPRFSNPRNAVLMRRGEKEVLTFYIDLMKMCIPLFKCTDAKDCMAKINANKRLRQPDSFFAQYVTHVVIPLIQRQMR